MASDDDDNKNLQIALKKRRQQWPKWLNSVLGEPFFTLCEDHKDCRKNEKNIYCLDCDARICQNCLVCLDSSKYSHLQHNLLRIRRYVYQDVIRIQDLHKFMDCTKIQSFTVNAAKVILLNPKKKNKTTDYSFKDFHGCANCRRIISHPNLYCSISCKVTRLDKFDNVCTSNLLASTDSDNLPINGSFRKRKRKGIAIRSPLF
ncbi:PLATZ transcription factor family protein [Zostera marina]|uniref:PLATZ transcription factor family protein n=1 Tax=Zostera marina TaxID=29655 RepID=A0A0K9PL11_ZOSMR|nr:PLATZ transcription factor family protein [Zostera marina]